ncbi:MAG: hypothetical protein EZS28_027208, partial [Streblomastix strix]
MTNILYVRNLSFSATHEQVLRLFEEVGPVLNVDIQLRKDGRSKGHGYVTMNSEEDTQRALQSLNNRELDGRNIKVSIANPEQEKKTANENLFSQTCIHLDNLPGELNESELRAEFQGFAIKDIIITRHAVSLLTHTTTSNNDNKRNYGGVIYFESSQSINAQFEIEGCDFFNCGIFNGSNGGAIYFAGTVFIAAGCRFLNCYAKGSGGAICINSLHIQQVSVIDKCIFNNNSVGTNGLGRDIYH